MITMKKIAMISLAAVIGSLVSIATYKLFDEPAQTIVYEETPKYNSFVNNIPAASVGSKDFVAAADMSLNAVVHVKTKGEQEVYDPFHYFFYGQGKSREVMSSGSGVILSADGYVVTNNHVIQNANEIEIVTNDRQTFDAKIIGTDPNTDLALLKIEGSEQLPYIAYGNSDQLEVGEWVLAVGNPFNLTSTVTAGIVSAKGRKINILRSDPQSGMSSIESFIQTDAAVNPGNSGGALVNTQGQLVGINTAIQSRTGSYIGYSFAIPVNIVKKVVSDLRDFGAVQRAFIGVNIRDIDKKLAQEKGIKDMNGVYVTGLAEKGAAADAGIQEGDIIVKVGNTDTKKVSELQEQIGQFRPGDEVLITLIRDNKELEKKMVLKNIEGNTEIVKVEKPSSLAELGANFQEVSKGEMKKLGISGGVKVSQLYSGKLRQAGMKEGFIITEIDNKRINNLDELSKALAGKKGGVLFEGLYPNGRAMYYGVGI